MTESQADQIIAALRGAFARDVAPGELLRLAASRLVAERSGFQSAGIYLVDSGGLGREAMAGIPTGPERIETAFANGHLDDQLLGVTGGELGSSLAVAIRRGNQVLGCLVVRSTESLPPGQSTALQKVADALAVLL